MKSRKENLRLVALIALFFLGALPSAQSSTRQLQLKAELQQSLIPAHTNLDAVIKISIVAPETVEIETQRKINVNLAIILDKSGSMGSSQKLVNAKAAAIAALGMLGRDDIFSLVVYDGQARTIVPAREVTDKREIEAAINGIRANGSTALFSGVSLGANEIRKHLRKGYINRIILLSDGLANIGPSSPKELGRMGASLIKEGISVSTIGVGNDYNEDLMTELSQNSDGNFYFVENSNDLPLIFSKELGSALKVTAKSLNIQIEFPKGIKPQGILGRDCKILDNKMDIFFNQVYGGHEKTLILQVQIPPEEANRKIDLASIKMNYEDAVSGETIRLARAVSAKTSADREKVEKSYNKIVLKDYSLMNNAVMKQQAIEEADRGNWKKANSILSKATKQLQETAEETGDKELQLEVTRNLKHEEAMKEDEKRGKFSQRKTLRGEAYQSINSQMYQQKK